MHTHKSFMTPASNYCWWDCSNVHMILTRYYLPPPIIKNQLYFCQLYL